MTTFHPQQFDRGQCAHQKAGISALQISVTNYTTKLRDYVYEARKVMCNKLQGAVQEHVIELSFYTREALPLSQAKVSRLGNGSPELVRSPARWSRNVRDATGKTSGEMSRATVAQCPLNRRAAAGALPPDGRRDDSQDNWRYAYVGRAASAPETRKTTRNMAAQRRRSSRAIVHATVGAISRKQLVGFSPSAFNHHIKKL